MAFTVSCLSKCRITTRDQIRTVDGFPVSILKFSLNLSDCRCSQTTGRNSGSMCKYLYIDFTKHAENVNMYRHAYAIFI